MRLHVKLTANLAVVVDNQIRNVVLKQQLAGGKSRWSSTNNGYSCSEYLLLLLGLWLFTGGDVVLRNFLNFLYSINKGYADTLGNAINKHLAGTAFADTALEATLAVL